MTRTLILALAPFCFLPHGATAQEEPELIQGVAQLRHADAAQVAEILGQHFTGGAKFTALPGPTPAVLFSVPPDATDRIGKLIEIMDRAPKTITVELIFLDVDSPPDGSLGESLTGPADDVLKKVEAAITGGHAEQLRRVRLTVTECSTVQMSKGGSVPHVTSSAGRVDGRDPRGLATRSIQYMEKGLTVQADARVTADGTVILDLDLKDSFPKQGGNDGESPGAPTFHTNSLTTRLAVKSGHAVAAQAVDEREDKRGVTSLVIVTAQVMEEGGNGEE